MKRFTLICTALCLLPTAYGCGFLTQAAQRVTCKTCNGKGLCWWCGGSGKGLLGTSDSTCNGTGRCTACDGIGFTLK